MTTMTLLEILMGLTILPIGFLLEYLFSDKLDG